MSDNNGWPYPARPGVPLNPDQERWHWLKTSYLGPCFTPAEVEARVKEAQRDAMEKAARRLEELHRQHKYNPKTGEGSEHDVGYYRALSEGAGWIRALDPLASKGAADLVAQARRERGRR